MIDEVGSFRIDVQIGNPARPGERRDARNVLIATGAELSCFPGDILDALGIARGKMLRVRQADGSVLERWTGSGIVFSSGSCREATRGRRTNAARLRSSDSGISAGRLLRR